MVVFIFLVDAAYFFVDQDGFFVEICILDKVSKEVEDLHGLLW